MGCRDNGAESHCARVLGMNAWQWPLCFIGIGYVVIYVVVALIVKWHRNRYLHIPRGRIIEGRVSPQIPFAMRDQK